MKRRRCAAFALVAILFAAVALSGYAQAEEEQQPALKSDVSSVIAYVEDPESSSLADGYESCDVLPVSVSGNCFLLSGARDIYRSEDGVVGFVVNGDLEDVANVIAEQMEAYGWKDMPSGVSGTTSYFREEGEFTWALLSLTQIGEDVSVVIQLQ